MIRGSFVNEFLLLGCFVFLPLIVIAVIIPSVAFLFVDFVPDIKLSSLNENDFIYLLKFVKKDLVLIFESWL